MYMNGVVIGMEKAIIIAAQVIIQEEQKAAVTVFCVAGVGSAIRSTVGFRIAIEKTAALTIGSAALAYALS